jgi:hypothetical protein
MPPFAACKLISPPYLEESPWRGQPPLGSILLWHLSTHPPDVRMLLDAHAAAPWCGLVIRLPEFNSGIDLDELYDSLSRLTCLPVALRSGMSPFSAIRNRRPPTAAEVVRYIQARPGHEQLAAQLRLLIAGHATELSQRSVREHLKRSNRFGPRHWQWVIALAQIRTLAHESNEALAGRYGMDVRTLRHHVRTCLAVSLEEFRHLIGWEWRVEAALRLDRSKNKSRGGARSAQFDKARWLGGSVARWAERLPALIPAQPGIHDGSPEVNHHTRGPHGLLPSQE